MSSPPKILRITLTMAALLLGGPACEDVFEQRDTIEYFDVFAGDQTLRQDVHPDARQDTWRDTNDPPPGDAQDTPPDSRPDTTPDTPDTRPDTASDTRPDADTTQCHTDADCPDARPRCQRERGVCVQCAVDTDCATGWCEPFSGTCRQRTCYLDDDCFVPAEVCSTLLDPWSDGYCVPACIPFTSASGCTADQWCLPSITVSGVGACTWSQPGSPGGSYCDTFGYPLGQGTCADEHLCLEFESGGMCFALCDPAAFPGTPGDRCGTGYNCLQMQYEDPNSPTGVGETAFGICYGSCDYHAGVPCLDPGAVCSPGELYAVDWDICVEAVAVPERERCGPYGLAEGDLCGATSICVRDMMPEYPGERCWDVCIVTPTAPLGMQGHPDCRRHDAVCTGVFATPELGLCL